jgi:hypothetical protein
MLLVSSCNGGRCSRFRPGGVAALQDEEGQREEEGEGEGGGGQEEGGTLGAS